MYLVPTEYRGVRHNVFTSDDPREAGYEGEIMDGVFLDYDLDAVLRWDEGEERPEAQLGRSKEDAKRYKVFKYGKDARQAGYEPLDGMTLFFRSWAEYARLRRPDPLNASDDE